MIVCEQCTLREWCCEDCTTRSTSKFNSRPTFFFCPGFRTNILLPDQDFTWDDLLLEHEKLKHTTMFGLFDWNFNDCEAVREKLSIPKFVAQDYVQLVPSWVDSGLKDAWPSLFWARDGAAGGLHVDIGGTGFWQYVVLSSGQGTRLLALKVKLRSKTARRLGLSSHNRRDERPRNYELRAVPTTAQCS